MNRRELIQMMFCSAAATSLPSLSWAGLQLSAQPKASRTIMLKSLHTGEAGEFKYLIDGQLVRPELERMFHLLRDHRSGDIHPIDSHVLEQLNLLKARLGNDTVFEIISAYRSPKTNAMLSGRSSGVAKKSLHMQGKAMDIRVSGTSITRLHQEAVALKAGGVGKYSKSGFVHIDSGRVRYWGA